MGNKTDLIISFENLIQIRYFTVYRNKDGIFVNDYVWIALSDKSQHIIDTRPSRNRHLNLIRTRHLALNSIKTNRDNHKKLTRFAHD